MQRTAESQQLVSAVLEQNKALAAERDALQIRIEQQKLALERKDMELQKLYDMYTELWERHEREMACYRDTVQYMLKTQSPDVRASAVTPQKATSTSVSTPARKAEQLARSLNMDIFK